MLLLKSGPAPVAVFWSAVLKESASANGCIEVAGGVAPQREHTNCSIVCAAREAKKSRGSFRRVASRIASIRRRIYGLSVPDKCNADEREHCVRNIRYCFHMFSSFHYVVENSEPKASITGC